MHPFYETSNQLLRISHSENMSFPLHLHGQLELLYVLRGALRVTVQNQSFLLPAGHLAVIFPNVLHSYQSEDDNEFLLSISDLTLSGSFLHQLTSSRPQNPFLSPAELHTDVLFSLQGLLGESKNTQDQAVYQAFLQLILARILPKLTLLRSRSGDSPDLTYQITAFISQNYQEHLSLDTVSQQLGISKFYLSRIFSEKFAMNFNQYLNSIRLQHAVELLRSTTHAITQVSEESGFDSSRTFYRVFRETYGQSPLQYRGGMGQSQDNH